MKSSTKKYLSILILSYPKKWRHGFKERGIWFYDEIPEILRSCVIPFWTIRMVIWFSQLRHLVRLFFFHLTFYEISSLKVIVSFHARLFLEITRLLSRTKSTLLLKNRMHCTAIYMKTYCLQTNETQHCLGKESCFRSDSGRKELC